MKTIEYRTIDKSSWPRGPWDAEPDKRQWQDEATGLPCLIVRVDHSGHLCGYVGVPPKHPLYEVSYSEPSDKLRAALERRLNSPMGDHPAFRVLISALAGRELEPCAESVFEVHGGITFSDHCHDTKDECRGICHKPDDGETDSVWWFGFDCAHCDDRSPASSSALLRERGAYRDFAYVAEECRKLAEQLAMVA